MRTVKSCGPDALVAGVPLQDAIASCEGGDKQAKSRRGEHEVSRNPSRRESRIAPVTPVVLPPSFLPIARGPWVRSAPGFPCALCSREGETRCTARTCMSRECEAASPPTLSSPGSTGRSSTPRPLGSSTGVSGILDHPHARVMTPRENLQGVVPAFAGTTVVSVELSREFTCTANGEWRC